THKMPQVKPIPDGYRTVTPYLTVDNANRAIEFYQKALGARLVMKMDAPGGKVGHAELKIGDSIIMLADEIPGGGSGTKWPKSLGGTTAGVFLYVENVDSFYKQAVAAGAKADMQPQNMFWGDRFGRFTDPFGHSWSVATHVEDVAPEEMRKRMQTEMQKMGAPVG